MPTPGPWAARLHCAWKRAQVTPVLLLCAARCSHAHRTARRRHAHEAARQPCQTAQVLRAGRVQPAITEPAACYVDTPRLAHASLALLSCQLSHSTPPTRSPWHLPHCCLLVTPDTLPPTLKEQHSTSPEAESTTALPMRWAHPACRCVTDRSVLACCAGAFECA